MTLAEALARIGEPDTHRLHLRAVGCTCSSPDIYLGVPTRHPGAIDGKHVGCDLGCNLLADLYPARGNPDVNRDDLDWSTT
jgi:hypothetical protein